MIFHRVVENSVHIDKRGLRSNARHVVLEKIVFNSDIFQNVVFLVLFYKSRAFEIISQRSGVERLLFCLRLDIGFISGLLKI